MYNAIAIAVALLGATGAFAQGTTNYYIVNYDSALRAADQEARSTIAFPFSLLIPPGLRIGYEMRTFIRSDAFGTFDSVLSNENDPEDVFNEIYYEALDLAEGNRSDALEGAAYGVFDHESIPFNFFGSEIDIPLTSERHSEYEKRVSHLPKYMYHTEEEDQDKFQHFFASAWLKSIVGMDWLVRLAGHAVEIGEKLFTIDGFIDPRDLHANTDGLRFELQIERNRERPPSNSLSPNPESPER